MNIDESLLKPVPNLYNESETVTKFEIMDGAPVRGETIPIRLFLGGFELAPTFRGMNQEKEKNKKRYRCIDNIYSRCEQKVLDEILSQPGVD